MGDLWFSTADELKHDALLSRHQPPRIDMDDLRRRMMKKAGRINCRRRQARADDAPDLEREHAVDLLSELSTVLLNRGRRTQAILQRTAWLDRLRESLCPQPIAAELTA